MQIKIFNKVRFFTYLFGAAAKNMSAIARKSKKYLQCNDDCLENHELQHQERGRWTEFSCVLLFQERGR